MPIAAIVLATRYRICLTPLQSSALLQLFVYGRQNSGTKKISRLDMRMENDYDDDEKLLSETDTNRQIQNNVREDPKNGTYLKFIWCFLGLQFSYLIWGILQEKIMTSKYDISSKSGISNSFIKETANETINYIKTSDSDLPRSDKFNLTTDNDSPTTFITFHDSQVLIFKNRIMTFIISIIAFVYFLAFHPKRSQYYQKGGSVIYQPNRQDRITKPPAPLYEYI